jgi:hypothetical protein
VLTDGPNFVPQTALNRAAACASLLSIRSTCQRSRQPRNRDRNRRSGECPIQKATTNRPIILGRRSVVRHSCSLSSRPNRLCQAIRRNFFSVTALKPKPEREAYIGWDDSPDNIRKALLRLVRPPTVEYSTCISAPLGLVQLLTGPFRVGGALYGTPGWLSR